MIKMLSVCAPDHHIVCYGEIRVTRGGAEISSVARRHHAIYTVLHNKQGGGQVDTRCTCGHIFKTDLKKGVEKLPKHSRCMIS